MKFISLLAIIVLFSAFSQSPTRIYFKDLRKYNMGARVIPADVKALDGKQVTIIGYMVPFDSVDKIDRFVLLQAPFMGCFHVPPPQPNESILVKTRQSNVSVTNDPVQITGTLKIEESYVEGYLVSLYTMNGATIRGAVMKDAELDGLPASFHMFSDF